MRPARLLLLIIPILTASPVPAADPGEISKTIADFKLHDYQGAAHALTDFANSKLVVVAFLGADCPLANRYADRLVEMARQYRPRGVAFLAIDANQQDSLAQIAHFARVHRIEFPLLKDPGNAIADRFGALRTPEVFVLDGERALRYRGRVDDQYGIGYARPAPKHNDLSAALEDLLAGKPVSRPITEASGCLIGRVQRQPARGEVIYTKQIVRILQRHCVSCHRAGSIAPFALTSYGDAAGWAETIREVVRDHRMPPWDADPRYGLFSNDPSLTDEEKQLLEKWVENGAPQGDPHELTAAPSFTDGWRISKPDLVLSMPEPFTVPAKGDLNYQYFTVDPGFQEDRWVQASEVRPGNPSVVHHVVVIVQPPGAPSPAERGGIGEPVALGVPGMWPLNFPEGTARFVPAGSKLVFQMHYTPNGTVQTDQTRVGLVFADPKKVRKAIRSDMALNVKLNIPAGEADYTASADYRFGQDAILYALFPHMHLRGKSFRFTARYPDGTQEVLLHVPRYRFDWQNRYVLTQPKPMPEGTVLHCEGHFDNSEANLSNPNPAATVRFGEQTWNEMLVGYFDLALADQDLRAGLPQVSALSDGRYEVRFHYQAPAGTKSAFLAGEFNNWKTDAQRMDGPDATGLFTTKLTLKPGRYEYKLVLDGKNWRHDPANPQQAGYFHNSVLFVPERASAAK